MHAVGIPKDSALGCLLENCTQFKLGNLKRKKLTLYWDAWKEKKKNGSLNYNTILQLDLFCKQESKWEEIPYVMIFMALYQHPKLKENCRM
ncbi:natural cytotoxicity triggering receptor 3 ligand 1-like [Mustela lutreola]|uniref:natural cytotoxicity triggering receptor 3 ligand 1-like n=1 Tax=Mustela lutreola TaxID=9666 RepID=UPI0027975770|nr:natural cytotoxicity triggering receptor 3 ligand 1-like [Mustela lutreola]